MKITNQTPAGMFDITAEEIQQQLDQGMGGMLSFMKGYTIGTTHCFASGLTLFPHETKIFERDGKLIVTAYFKEYMLPYTYRTGNDENLVNVECQLDPSDMFFVSLHNMNYA